MSDNDDEEAVRWVMILNKKYLLELFWLFQDIFLCFAEKQSIRSILCPPCHMLHHEDFNILIIFGSSRSQDHASFNNFADLLSIIFPAKIKVKSNLLSEDVQQELVAKPQ